MNNMLTDEQSKLNARLEAHMVYICPECGKAFRTQAEWRQHLNSKHDYLNKTYTDFNFIQIDERFHECQLCFKWVENAHKTIALLQYHYFMHLDHRDTYRCVHCRSAYTRRRALNVHLMETHLREIEQYEAKIRHMNRKHLAQKPGRAPTLVQTQTQPRKRNDLLQKALMDIDLQGEVTSPAKPKPNASELALDRCLNAYEDIVRKEEEQSTDDLDALCQEFFEDKATKIETAESGTNESNKEVVTIEIDALGEEEVDKLKKEMNPTPAAKRRRVSTTPERESDSELSIQGLTKFITYLCPQCNKEIATMDDWRTHVFEKHDFDNLIENSFKILEPGRSMCLQCHELQPTSKRSELQRHCFKHLPYRSYLKCILCERTKTSMSKIYNHIRHNHQAQLLIKPEPMSMSLKRVQNTDSDSDLQCAKCHKIFKQRLRLQRHRAICKAAEPLDVAADALLAHLREGRVRMNAIWTVMKMEGHGQ